MFDRRIVIINIAVLLVICFLTIINGLTSREIGKTASLVKQNLDDILPERSVQELKLLLSDNDIDVKININITPKEEHETYTQVLYNFKKKLSKPNREIRFRNSKCPDKIIVWTWKGSGTAVREQQLFSTIKAVLHRLPHIKANEDTARLLLETAAV